MFKQRNYFRAFKNGVGDAFNKIMARNKTKGIIYSFSFAFGFSSVLFFPTQPMDKGLTSRPKRHAIADDESIKRQLHLDIYEALDLWSNF